jgi:hypothetical protein
MAKLDAYTVNTVVPPQKEDRDMVSTLVAKSAEIQADYSECDDEGRKREIAMECHTSMRSFDEGASAAPASRRSGRDRHQIQSPKRPTKSTTRGRLPQSDLPQ